MSGDVPAKNGAAGTPMLFKVYTDIKEFSAKLRELSIEDDPELLIPLDANYIRYTDNYLILSIKDFETDRDNILFLNSKNALVYTKKPLDDKCLHIFEKTLKKPNGITTVVAFTMLDLVFESYKKRYGEIVNSYKQLEATFDEKHLEVLNSDFERFYDKIDDLTALLTSLEKQRIKEVDTKLISFDYSLLVAEATRLLERTETRMSMLRNLATAYEMKVTRQLNKRIEILNDAVKVLTAITIIMMIPNIIAGHFGMNFRYMPELEVWWAYPAVISSQIVLVVLMIWIFRKKKYL